MVLFSEAGVYKITEVFCYNIYGSSPSFASISKPINWPLSISTEIIRKPVVLMEVNSLNPLNASVAPI